MENFKFTSLLAMNPEWVFKAVLDSYKENYVITNETTKNTIGKDWMTVVSAEDVEKNIKEGNYKFVH